MDITLEDNLLRFILQSKWVRQDKTIRPNAFIPHPHDNFSVTVRGDYSDEDVWEKGECVALKSGRTLYGFADNLSRDYLSCNLQVKSDPEDDNPNHAIILGWPTDKSAQKELAIIIASKAIYSEKK